MYKRRRTQRLVLVHGRVEPEVCIRYCEGSALTVAMA